MQAAGDISSAGSDPGLDADRDFYMHSLGRKAAIVELMSPSS